MSNIWIGKNYCTSPHRILVLGESWYGENGPLSTWIEKWADGDRDATFSRIFNAACGSRMSKADRYIERMKWWHEIAFYNFVASAGPTRKHRPTKELYEAAKLPLEIVLHTYKPKGVWVLGKGQSDYSESVIKDAGIPWEKVAHPTSYGLKTADLRESWKSLQSRIPVNS